MVTRESPELAVSVEEAARRLHIGRSLAWSLVWEGRLRTVRLGRRRVVPVKVLEELMAENDESN